MPGGKTAIIKGLRNIYRMVLTSSLMVSVRLFRFVPGLIGQLAAGKRVLWITSNAHVIVDNLNNLDFKHFYGLHDIVHNASINAAPCKPCSGYPASISVDESYADIQEKLVKSEDFDIAFVEAGVTGKLVCHHIKANLDKTAIDIGFMTSALRGDRDHDALLPNKLMHSFVWDPSRS